ncbi:MAG: hypothetical protein U5L72_14555 [Bacteroidales bacterium]|nr:hypothetical protein [Bacteroidales bacterium]
MIIVWSIGHAVKICSGSHTGYKTPVVPRIPCGITINVFPFTVELMGNGLFIRESDLSAAKNSRENDILIIVGAEVGYGLRPFNLCPVDIIVLEGKGPDRTNLAPGGRKGNEDLAASDNII